jgi:hypothetical protein
MLEKDQRIINELNNTAQRMFSLARKIEQNNGADKLSNTEKKTIRLAMLNFLETVQSEQALFFVSGEKQRFERSLEYLNDFQEFF